MSETTTEAERPCVLPEELRRLGPDDGLTPALLAALDKAMELADERGLSAGVVEHRATLSRLKPLGLANADGTLTDLGRRQVRWYTDDIGLLWDVNPDTINSYVGTTSLPGEDGKAIVGRHARRWWRPDTVLRFKRPGMGGPGPRVHLDVQSLVRDWRSGGASMRALARKYGVNVGTVKKRLEAAGCDTATTPTPPVMDSAATALTEGIAP